MSDVVQEKIEDSLAPLAGGHVPVTAAGRTDAGVHARAQVISFVLDREWRPDKLLLAMNYYLPPDIRVMRAARAAPDFDARRSALWREYRYLVWHGNAMPPLLLGLAWWNRFHWDREAAARAELTITKPRAKKSCPQLIFITRRPKTIRMVICSMAVKTCPRMVPLR